MSFCFNAYHVQHVVKNDLDEIEFRLKSIMEGQK